MKKRQFKEAYRWIRKIKNSMVGTHGHLSDVREKYGISHELCSIIYHMNDKPKRLIYGKYTKEYIDNQNYIANCESYYERIIGA